MRVHGIARWTHIVNPSAPKGSDKKKHSITILIPKNDPQCQMIHAEVEQAKLNGFPSGFPVNGYSCWSDCQVSEPNNPHVANYMALSSSTNVEQGMPTLADHALQPIIDPAADGRIDGMMVYVEVGVASFDQVSKGVKTYLNGVMVTQQPGPIPKEHLTNKPDAKQMFGDVAGGGQAAAPQANAPMQQAAPAPTPPAPPVPPPAPAPVAQYQMTAAANGLTRDQYIASGWSDEQLIAQGMMLPPNGVAPSFS